MKKKQQDFQYLFNMTISEKMHILPYLCHKCNKNTCIAYTMFQLLCADFGLFLPIILQMYTIFESIIFSNEQIYMQRNNNKRSVYKEKTGKNKMKL